MTVTFADIREFFTDSAALNNFVLLGFIFVFTVIFFLESRDEKSPLYWPDLILDSKTQHLSLAKFGQFCGIAVSTWITIFLAQNPDAYGIFPMVFPMYLAYIGGTWSYNAWLKSKQGQSVVLTADMLAKMQTETPAKEEPLVPEDSSGSGETKGNS